MHRPTLSIACLVAALCPFALPLGRSAIAESPRPTQGSPYVIEGAYPAWRRIAYPPASIPYDQVTRVSHAAVWPDANGDLVVPAGLVTPELVDASHAAGRPVVLVVGGASRHDAFATMTADPSARATFIESLAAFVVDQGYDGVEIDWEFPQSAQDRDHLTGLVAELHAALAARGREPGLSLCVALAPALGQWIDAECLTPLVDYYLVMAYNQHSAGSAVSGHNAALYSPAGEEDLSVDAGIRYWTDQRGVPPGRVLLGVPFYGNSFDSEGLGLPFTTFGQAYYRDIAPLAGQGFTRHWDTTGHVPYLTEDVGPLVWSYDDGASIAAKCDYARDRGLAGIAIWDITGDLPEDEGSLLAVIVERMGVRRGTLYVPIVSRPATPSGR